ncbi:hypothetical protein GMRT_11672 [Giardia muris]|uniref:Uncharacterized protein n=1 Tax=Giardia muris TaxID=5742 RepID=A0A4Z1SUN1_GIAMU|nr:hypothetical protein GMRT_11672 [Giardia muris]|eukprot:TNJ29534.1 hypothetical protein GMRT_11672 [Giardia muris]
MHNSFIEGGLHSSSPAVEQAVAVRDTCQWLECMLDETRCLSSSASRLAQIALSAPHTHVTGIVSPEFLEAWKTMASNAAMLSGTASESVCASLRHATKRLTSELSRDCFNLDLEARKGRVRPRYVTSVESPIQNQTPSIPSSPTMVNILRSLEDVTMCVSVQCEDVYRELLHSLQRFLEAPVPSFISLQKVAFAASLHDKLKNFSHAVTSGKTELMNLNYRQSYLPPPVSSDSGLYSGETTRHTSDSPLDSSLRTGVPGRDFLQRSGLGTSPTVGSPLLTVKGRRSPSTKNTALLHSLTQRYREAAQP